MKTPVIFLVFNRPDLTRRVFARIREARPPVILAVCDGPRESRSSDQSAVAEVRRIIDEGVDWPCIVFKNYAPTNMGCRARVASGITWAFEQVEEAIILEDDCLPDPSFFSFCETLLGRYRNDTQVMHIGGTNFIAEHSRPKASCFFTHHPWIWGWATWRRAWREYDPVMSSWSSRLATLTSSFASRWEAAFWMSTYEKCRRAPETVDTWDFQWQYTCRSLGGVSILPSRNLIENLGFGVEATHTGQEMRRLYRETSPLPEVEQCEPAARSRFVDELVTRIYAGETPSTKANLKARLRVVADRFRPASFGSRERPLGRSRIVL